VLFVFLLAPLLGELLSSSMPIPEFLVGWLPVAVLYGCGALLIREAAVRRGTGWAAIILLGMAYGIYEEGLVVRSFFDPEWQDLGALGEYGRAGGVNWLWSELLTLFHAAVPVASTLLIAEVVFPDRKGRPWLRRRGLIWNGIGFAAWLPLGAVGFMEAPAGHLIATGIVVLLLTAAAMAVRSPLLAPRRHRVPRPRWFFLAGASATAATFLGIYIPAGAYGDGATSVPSPWAAGLGVAGFVVLVAWWVIRRSGNASAWDDRHRVALVWGILAFMSFLTTFAGGPFGPLVAACTMYAMWRLHRTVAGLIGEVPA
jgi:hypothetical protein